MQQRGAAVQSTENEARTPETIIHEAETAIWKDSEYFTAEDVFVLAKALATERDRADRAEARLAEVWDEGAEYGVGYSITAPHDNPYRAEATA
jgi:hypothetical protein